jgi:hypothetical protein
MSCIMCFTFDHTYIQLILYLTIEQKVDEYLQGANYETKILRKFIE